MTNETIKTLRNLNDLMPGGRFCGRRLSADLGDGIKRNYLNVAYGIVAKRQIYEKEIIQTNNSAKNEKIQRNNSAKFEKIQRNILNLYIVISHLIS